MEQTEQTRTAACDSCGSVEEVVLVRRFYITPEAWDTPGSIEPAGEEWWCWSCRTHYPHQVLDADGNPIVDELG